MIRKSVTVSGHVQGVGFRYRAYHSANRLGLTGWVKNNWDGSVSLELQGDEAAIDKLFEMVQAGTFVSIDKIYARTIDIDSEERDFKIL